MRLSALRALIKSQLSTGRRALQAAFLDTHWEVRAVAARIVGEQKMSALIPELVKGLQDSDWWVRRNSSFSLYELGEEGQQCLRAQLQSGDKYAREMAEFTLQLMTANQRGVTP